jgi:hypothetical protein
MISSPNPIRRSSPIGLRSSPIGARARLLPLLPARTLPALMLTALVLIGAGCASSGASKTPADPEREIRPIGDLVAREKKPDSIGKFLSDLNNDIKAWNGLFLRAQTDEEKARCRLMETHITTVAHQRRAEIVTELESGPLNNRIVAAAALGFTHDVEAQSPLLAALDDQHEDVVSNALYGLWLLGRSDTPADRICPMLSSGRDEGVRTQASLLLMSLTAAGATDPCIAPAARLALIDDSPAVRTHCLLIIANLKDSQSLQAVVDSLHDDKPIVVSAAARALTYLSAQDPHSKGLAARALVKAWVAAKEPMKTTIFRALVETAQSNYGTDEKEWAKWAERLP